VSQESKARWGTHGQNHRQSKQQDVGEFLWVRLVGFVLPGPVHEDGVGRSRDVWADFVDVNLQGRSIGAGQAAVLGQIVYVGCEREGEVVL
jgi:hypothetical protein